MRHYDSHTAKRHIGFANSPAVAKLDKGRLSMAGFGRNSKIKTCEKYRDGAGKLRYKGTSHLKSTELLGCCCSQGMLSCYHMIDDHLNVV